MVAPENFAELSAKHNRKQLAAMLRVSERQITRWRKELGLVKSEPAASLPADIDDIVRRGASWSELSDIMGRHRSTVRQIMQRDRPDLLIVMAQEPRERKPYEKRTMKDRYRQMPAGFAEDARVMNNSQLHEKYRARWSTLKRWRDELGIAPPTSKIVIPDNIEELSRTMTVAEIARHCGYQSADSFRRRFMAENPAAYAMARRNGLALSIKRARELGKSNVVIPEGFAAKARGMSVVEAARHYGVRTERIRTWSRAIGNGLPEAMAANGAEASKRAAAARRKEIAEKKAARPDVTLAEKVMTHIRRATRFIVHSDRIYGGSGDVYYVGNRKMDWDGLMAVAQRYGFTG